MICQRKFEYRPASILCKQLYCNKLAQQCCNVSAAAQDEEHDAPAQEEPPLQQPEYKQPKWFDRRDPEKVTFACMKAYALLVMFFPGCSAPHTFWVWP